MKQKLTPRWIIMKLTSLLFAAYSAYSIFVIVRTLSMPPIGKVILAFVALFFAALAVFVWLSDIKDIRFVRVRKTVLIISLFTIFSLKLRMLGAVIEYVDFSKFPTVLYGISYVAVMSALILLFIYYAFILKRRPRCPKVSVILPLIAAVLFVCSLALETILFPVFHIITEANPLRAAVSRPIFYFGFIGLSVFFMFPPKKEEIEGYIPPDDSEFIKPADDKEYVPPEGSENVVPDSSGFVSFDEAEYTPPKGQKHINVDDSGFVKPDESEYVPPVGSERVMPDADDFIKFDESKYPRPEGKKYVNIDDTDFVAFDESQYKPPKGTKHINVDDSDFIRPDNTEYVPPKGSGKAKPKDTDLFTP